MSDIEFIDGLSVKAPRENAPGFVIGSLSMHRLKLIAYLQAQTDDFVNADIKVAKSNKWYVAKDSWKPAAPRQDRQEAPRRSEQRPAASTSPAASNFIDDDIPF